MGGTRGEPAGEAGSSLARLPALQSTALNHSLPASRYNQLHKCHSKSTSSPGQGNSHSSHIHTIPLHYISLSVQKRIVTVTLRLLSACIQLPHAASSDNVGSPTLPPNDLTFLKHHRRKEKKLQFVYLDRFCGRNPQR